MSYFLQTIKFKVGDGLVPKYIQTFTANFTLHNYLVHLCHVKYHL